MFKFFIFLSFLCNSSFYVGKDKSTAPSDSSRLPSEVTAVPKKSPNYVVIGASAGGGLLVLVIVLVIIRKCFCKSSTSTSKQRGNTGRVNVGLEGDFELSTILSRKT